MFSFSSCRTQRPAFTLVELLIAVSVIALIATMVLFAHYTAQEMARAQKTKSLIGRLDSMIKARFEAYKTRRVPISLGPDTFVDTSVNGTWEIGEPLIIDWNEEGLWDSAVVADSGA